VSLLIVGFHQFRKNTLLHYEQKYVVELATSFFTVYMSTINTQNAVTASSKGYTNFSTQEIEYYKSQTQNQRSFMASSLEENDENLFLIKVVSINFPVMQME